MVTVEMAAATLLLAAALAGACGVVAGGFRLAECQVTANEVARQQARGDAAAVAQVTRDRPSGSQVTVEESAEAALVTVTCDAQIGPVSVPLEATATVVTES